ncbi:MULTISPECIES: C40 family peptidase [Nocardioides]|uniref:C40 family peptidase n=1 Tax=Nocardioides vastitatis TaxID=2568655 RepID=A0ABW0ZHK1_9ACTN|nr:C40 family peptidase [Nocardioides sp.]THI97824.1 NlpC/P60 family protein [Nocardioides sp.]
MPTTLWRASARLIAVPLLASAFLLGPTDVATPDASASPTAQPVAGSVVGEAAEEEVTRQERRRKLRKERRERIVAAARSRAGRPYAYGAAGPNAFDCSGLTQWVFRRVGKRLPRTSDAQAGAVRHVRHPRRGDLVFFHNGGDVYHVGIYAGDHRLWHASRPGTPVRKDRIWTGSVFYGRVR